MQIITFLGIPFILLYDAYSLMQSIEVVYNVKNVNTDANLNATISIEKQAAAELAKGIQAVGSN